MEKKIFNVVEVVLGDKQKADRIVFNSIEEMDKAYNDIYNGVDIYVKDKDGLITKLLNSMISTKIADGSMQMCAKEKDTLAEKIKTIKGGEMKW